MDWNSVLKSSGPRAEPPPLERIELCWRMKGPSGKVLTCGVYRVAQGVEVRCGYGEDDLIPSQFARGRRHRALEEPLALLKALRPSGVTQDLDSFSNLDAHPDEGNSRK